jgi:hypothetical protein
MKWSAIIGDRQIQFSSALAAEKFWEKKGTPVSIVEDDRPSAELRRFFEGAVVPYVFYQSATAWSNFRECREALKLEFLPGWTRDMRGVQVRTPRSTSELSKDGFRGFLGKIEVWMMDNAMDWPESDAYKAWRDSGPLKGEVYPPLARLKAVQEARQNAHAPWKNAQFWR